MGNGSVFYAEGIAGVGGGGNEQKKDSKILFHKAGKLIKVTGISFEYYAEVESQK